MAKEILLLDENWKFHRGEIEPKEALWGLLKSGTRNQSGARKNLDDSAWRTVRLPHDFVIEGEFTPPPAEKADRGDTPEMGYLQNLHVLHGSLKGDVAWYRKTIRVDGTGKRVFLKFDGVYRDSQVYVNNYLVGSHASGYTEAVYDITDFLEDDGDNVVAVRVDARTAEGWYYEGGGIYRHVWLVTTPLLTIDRHGVFVKTAICPETHTAKLTIQTCLVNYGETCQEALLQHRIQTPGGSVIAVPGIPVSVAPGETKTVEQTAEIADPELWDTEHPNLYRLCSDLSGEENSVVSFGIREIRFDPQSGFRLNGKRLMIKGMCCHQDHGGLGVALPDGMYEYRIRKLKEMGCNAYRCAHHPAPEELLEVCDRQGILVMEENRLLSSSEDSMAQVREMVLTGRSHPSVILWSIANEEVHIQFKPQARKIASSLRRLIRTLDDTRPVTAAVCMWEAEPKKRTVTDPREQGEMVPSLDVFGFNYFSDLWDAFHAHYPDVPLICTEDSTFSETRGCRKTKEERCHLCVLDRGKDSFPAGEKEWKAAVQREYLAGTFLWTGFDYYGEPSPYSWPAVASQFGVMDLCGFPKDTYYYYKSWWSGEDTLHLCGNDRVVWCFTNCDEAELFRDGVSLGRRPVEKDSFAEWKTDGLCGEITAAGYRSGEKILESRLEKGGPACSLRAEWDAVYPEKDGTRTAVVNFQLLDACERPTGEDDRVIALTLSGNAELLGSANGDPSCHARAKDPRKSTFHGKLQAILRISGEGELCARAEGMEPVRLRFFKT